MQQKIGPVAIAIAVILLVGFCYVMYKRSQPSLQADYDPKSGPPDYVKNYQKKSGGGPGGGGYQTPGGGGGGGGYQVPGGGSPPGPAGR